MWPQALGYLTPLRDPRSLAKQGRHYLYHPLWGGSCPTGAVKNDRIVLDRSGATPQGTFRFRMAENLTDSNLSALLEFKVTGMVQGDELEIEINRKKIPARRIKRSHDADGQPNKEGRPLPTYYLYRIKLTSAQATFGDNQLDVRLIKSVGKEKLDIQEVEVTVEVKG